MSEKPLHVQVAEALGWSNFHSERHGEGAYWYGLPPRGEEDCTPAPRYDTDWSATGPLIHRFKLRILPMWDEYASRDWRWQVTPYYGARGSKKDGLDRFGDSDAITQLMPYADRNPQTNAVIFLDAPTELIGACYLLIAMAKAGQLKEPKPEDPDADPDPVRP